MSVAHATPAGNIPTGHRDLRDIAVSIAAIRPQASGLALERLEIYAHDLHDHWQPVAVYDLAYEETMEDPRKHVNRMARRLKLDTIPIWVERRCGPN